MHSKVMYIDYPTKNEALNVARSHYGLAVHDVLASNEIAKSTEVVPFGSLVTYVEIGEDKQPTTIITYPIATYNLEDPVKAILSWFKTANPRDTIKNKDVSVQIGCHIEEFKEMLKALEGVDKVLIDEARVVLGKLEKRFKELPDDSYDYFKQTEGENLELIDSLCDQIVTSIGIGYRMGFDIHGALLEVNESNRSKFEDGKPVYNEDGKIMKGKHYRKPDLKRFI